MSIRKFNRIEFYFAVFLALAAFYYLVEVRFSNSEDTEEARATRIFDVDFDNVAGLNYYHDGQEYRLVRKDLDQWMLEQPIQSEADRWQVENLIRQAIQGEIDREFKEKIDDLSQFGLDKPRTALTLLGKDKALAPTLFIGSNNPAGQLRYARLGKTGRVFTVVKPWAKELEKTLYDLRDKSLMRFPAEKVDELRITGRSGQTVSIKKQGLRTWTILKPESGPADDEIVQKILYHGLKGRVKEFQKSNDASDLGFDHPTIKVEAFADGKHILELLVGKPKDSPAGHGNPLNTLYWVKSDEHEEIMLAPESAVNILDQSLYTLKDRHVLHLDARRIHTVKLVRGDVEVLATRGDYLWEVKKPGNAVSGDEEITNLVRALESLRYKRLLEDDPETVKKYGLDTPDIGITLIGPDEHINEILISLKPVETDFLAVKAGNNPVALIDKADLAPELPSEVRSGPEAEGKKGE